MTDNSTDNQVDIGNFADFKTSFWNEGTQPEGTPEVTEEAAENGEDSPATDEDEAQNTPDDESEGEDENDEDDVPEPKAKPKSKTQQRIEKLLERERLANERAYALEKRLVALEAEKEVKPEEKAPLSNKLAPDAPKPDAVDKEGKPVYPLGEFDPQFIADLTRFTVDKEMKAAEQAANEKVQQQQIAAAQKEINDHWNANMARVEEELPDIREKITDLVETFGSLEPNYGEYLAGTIMSCEHGPEIMYYLSQNIGEAQKIVASGPAAATLTIGKLEARFVKPDDEADKRNKRIPSAKEPPSKTTRGSSASTAVRGDTRDFAAFKRDFFK